MYRSMYRVAGLLLTASAVRYTGQLVLLVLIARLLDPATLGTYTVALAICAPVYIVAGFGIRTVYLTLRTAIPWRSYERFLMSALAIAYAVVVIIAFVVSPAIAQVLLAVSAIRTVELLSDLYDAMLQRAGRPGLIVAVMGSSAVVQVIAVGAVLLPGGSLPAALWTSFAVCACNLLCLARPVATRAVGAARSADAGSMRPWALIFSAGLSTGVAVGMITLLSTVPQYLLALGGEVADAGRFAVLLYIIVATEMLLNALAQSWIPHARALFAAGRLTARTVAATSARWVLIVGPIGMLGIGAAAVVLPLVLGPSYAITPATAAPLALVVVVVPGVFAADTAIVVHNRYALSLVISLGALALGATLGFALVAAGLFTLTAALWTFASTMSARLVGGCVVLSTMSRASNGTVAMSIPDVSTAASNRKAQSWHQAPPR